MPGYRRLARLLADAGRGLGCDPAQRIWRSEGRKCPGKQTQRDRFWLNNAPWSKLRPRHCNPARSGHFVEVLPPPTVVTSAHDAERHVYRGISGDQAVRRIGGFESIETTIDVMLKRGDP